MEEVRSEPCGPITDAKALRYFDREETHVPAGDSPASTILKSFGPVGLLKEANTVLSLSDIVEQVLSKFNGPMAEHHKVLYLKT